MFIAINRFRVFRGREYEFELRWRERETGLQATPGFISVSLLRNWLGDDTTEYVSHSTWRSREDFDAWRAGQTLDYKRNGLGAVLADHPDVSVYEPVMTTSAREQVAR